MVLTLYHPSGTLQRVLARVVLGLPFRPSLYFFSYVGNTFRSLCTLRQAQGMLLPITTPRHF